MVITILHAYRNAVAATLAAAATLLLVGCGSNPRFTDYHAFVQEPRRPASSAPYTVGPPDVLEFKSSRVREVNNYRETVSPDGYVNVPLLGRVEVAGRTVASIQAELEDRARFYYQDADVNVRVTKYASKKLFVFGQVTAPGPYFYNGSNTILDTLAQAKPNQLADPGAILIVRPDENGELRARMTIDLDHMIRTGDTTLNAVLQDGDIVYVPPSGLGKVALTFQHLLLPFQPISQTINGPADVSVSANGQRPYGDAE